MKYKLHFGLLIAALSVFILLLSIFWVLTARETLFIPPEFDTNTQSGEPVIPSNLPYGSAVLGEYRISMASVIPIKDQKAYIYFANHAPNTTWMKIRFFNSNGELIGESGLIKPNEYLEFVTLNQKTTNASITVKVMCYEPETYHSKGSSQITLPTIEY